MFGQGSPNFHRYLCRLTQRQRDVCGSQIAHACGLVVALLVSWCALAQQTRAQDSHRLNAYSEEAPSDLKLRFAWGGGVPQKWRGKISIENGSFTNSRILSITSDAPSTVVRRNDELTINHRISTSYGGVDASIRISGDTVVRAQLKSETGEAFERTWTLKQLGEGINEAIDSQQNRLSISRTPGDKVRVQINRPHLVFEPGETWQFETNLQRCGSNETKVSAKFTWRRDNVELPVQGTPDVFETNAQGTSAPQTAEITVPQTEGVHNLWIEVEPLGAKPSFGQFRKPKTLARCVQIVVAAPSRDRTESLAPWKTYQTITPEELRGSLRTGWPVPRLRASKEPIRKGEVAVVETDDSEAALEMSPNASLTIPIYRPEGSSFAGPIRVSFRYRSIPGVKLGVNYLSSRQQVLHGQDSGVSVSSSATNEQWLTHSFHIWPEKEPGYLFIANDSERKALIGSVTFESGPSRLPESNLSSRKSNSNSNPIRRERMASLESPDFGGLFQAQRVIDVETGQALDDWGTFFDSVNRLTQHLKAHAYDGAFVTIAADGSAIFPSGGLATGPRFDSGVFASSGCDPVQKDVVELMLRMFDREGLKLVPVLTLNSTLEQLESLRESELMSFDLVSDEGQVTKFDQRLLPIYNPLDRNLQGVCSAAIGRITSRYGSHPSFSGLALACRPDCCTLLPGSRHGFDNITLQRFLQSENIEEAGFDPESLLIENPENTLRESWLSWRANQIALWYRDMATILQGSQRPLYIMPIDIYRRQAFVSSMSPSLHRGGDFAKVMRESGLGFGAETDSDGIIVLSTEEVAPGHSLSRRRTELNIKQSRSTEQYLANASDGVVFAHRGNWRSIDSGVNTSGLSESTRKQLYCPAGNSNRRRYIEAIRRFDSRLFVESGFSLPVGGEEELESLLGILRELPAKRFEDIGNSSSGPVCMRQLSLEGQHYFYAINDSPWPVEVTAWLGQKQLPQVLQASANANGQAAPLKTLSGKDVLLEQKDGRTQMQIFLEPWSMYAAAAQTNSTFNPYAIESFRVALPEGVDSQLRKRLHLLKSKLAKAKTSKPLPQLFNGSFESFVDPDRSGWEFGNHDQANFELNSADYRDGRVSLSMQTDGKPVWIRSNAIDFPETGRLSVSAWLKTSDTEKTPQPRISLEGTSDGTNFYRFGSVGVGGDSAPVLDGTWRRYVVHFDDLPEDLTNLRIGFDLMASGQVSIDQVEVYDRWLDENDSVAMTQLLASADSQLQNEESIDGARRVLESYWVQFLDQHIGREPKVEEIKEARNTFELSLPPLDMPSFELPKLTPPTKPKRVPLFQRFQRRE